MIIDCYEDIIKRYYSDLPVAFLESFREFLKVILPDLKRKDDPRNREIQAGKTITYECEDTVVRFERMAGAQYPILVAKPLKPTSEREEVLKVIVTPPMLKCYSIAAGEGMFIVDMDGPAATMYPTQANFRYYDGEATDYLLKGRDVLSFNVEQEISDLSMKPDGEVRLEETRDEQNNPVISTSTGDEIAFSGHTFMGSVASLNIDEICKQSGNTK